MSNQLVHRSLVVVLSALGVAALAGCGATGGAGGGGDGQAVVAGVAPRAQQASSVVEAAQTTSEVATQRVAITVRTDPAGNDPSVSVTANGEIDGAHGRAHLT